MKIRSEDNVPYVTISQLIEGGSAEASKKLTVGDTLVEINNVCMRHASDDEVVHALRKGLGATIELLVVRPEDLAAYEKDGKTSEAIELLEKEGSEAVAEVVEKAHAHDG